MACDTVLELSVEYEPVTETSVSAPKKLNPALTDASTPADHELVFSRELLKVVPAVYEISCCALAYFTGCHRPIGT